MSKEKDLAEEYIRGYKKGKKKRWKNDSYNEKR
jgi:hypothetical protein